MTINLAWLIIALVVLYLWAGVVVARWFAKYEMLILEVRWWHVVGWPFLVFIWLWVLFVIWGLTSK